MSGAATGVDGLGSEHEWVKADLTHLLTLGDLAADPLYKLIEIPDFYSTPDSDDNRHDRTGTYGEELVTSYPRGKNFEYHGVVQGSTRDLCLIGKSALLAAFAPQAADGFAIVERRMIMTPSSALTPDDQPALGIPHTYSAVCRQVVLSDQAPRRLTEEGMPPIRWAMPFELHMRITDGLFYEWDPVGHTQSNPKYA